MVICLLTEANPLSIIVIRSSTDTSQQNGGIVTAKTWVLVYTRIEPKDKISRTKEGKAAYRHNVLHVYVTGQQFPVSLSPNNVTWTRTDGGLLAGYNAPEILKWFLFDANVL